MATGQGGATKFQKGQSGNPGGRVKQCMEITELAKKEAIPAFLRIVQIAQTSEDEKTRMRANEYIVDRAYGKPAQAHSLEGADGSPLQVTVHIVGSEGLSVKP